MENQEKDKKEPQKTLTIPTMFKVNKDMKEMPEITNLAYFQPEKDDLHGLYDILNRDEEAFRRFRADLDASSGHR